MHVKILASTDCLASSMAVRTSCCCAERCARNDCPHGGSFSVGRKTLAHFQSNRTRGKVCISDVSHLFLFTHPTPQPPPQIPLPFTSPSSHPLSPRQLPLPRPPPLLPTHNTTSKSTHSPAGDFRRYEERSRQETNGTRTSSHKWWIAALDWQIVWTASWVNWTTQ